MGHPLVPMEVGRPGSGMVNRTKGTAADHLWLGSVGKAVGGVQN